MTELWSWRINGRVGAMWTTELLAEVIGAPVAPLDPLTAGSLPAAGMLCDIWYVPGAYPTAVDCYAPPEDLDELPVAAEFARRLGRDVLLPDDTLDPGRHLLCAPDGTIRPVHLDVADTDAGPLLTNLRPCTTDSPCCRGRGYCRRSRWAPDSVLPVLAAA